jgi:hypothetical protein
MKSLSREISAVGGSRRLRWVALAALVGVMVVAPSAGATVTLPPGSITVPSSGTFLYMNSQPGDWVGQGIERLYTSADSTITGSLPQGGGDFRASAIQGPYTHWWYVNIAAPVGQPLAIGSYTGAFRAPFRPAGSPGLDVYGDGRGCNTLTGQFDVNEVSYASTGELLGFDATFEQHCEGGSAALFGRIRIENAPPPPDVTPPTLNLSDVSVEAPDTSGTNVWYSATATDDRDSNPTVTCTPESGSLFPVGATTVNCQAEDRSGNVASGSFLVNVYAPLQFGLTLSTQGKVSSKTGVATISGKLNCSRAIPVDLSGTVKQLVANRVYVTGTFSVQIDCAAPSTSWSATLIGDNGKFGGGSVNVTVNAFGCELNCYSASAVATVRLNASK